MGGSGEVLLPLESVGCDQGEPRPQLGHPRVRGELSAPSQTIRGGHLKPSLFGQQSTQSLVTVAFLKVGFLTGL